MSQSPITKGNMALYHLTCALARAEGDDVDILAEAFEELAQRTDAFLARFDTPESARVKCERAIQTPLSVPQNAADSGARVPSPGARAAPSIKRGGP